MPVAGKILSAVAMLMWIPAAVAGGLISDVDVDVQLVKTPVIEHRRGNVNSSRSRSVNQWLMIRVEYIAEKLAMPEPALKKNRSGYTLMLGGFVDDLKLDVKVLQNTGLKVGGKELYGMYTGKTEFYTIRGDGKRHAVMMFIPGGFLDRYSRQANGRIRECSKVDFKVEAIFSASGRELARGYCGVSGCKTFEAACTMVPENLRFSGGVIPRSRTPWAWLETDDFDMEKDLSVRQN